MIANVIIVAVIAVVFIAIVATQIRNKINHKGGCGCGCSDCASRGLCHPEDKKMEDIK